MRRRRFLSSVGEAGGAALVTTLFGPETIRNVEAAAQRTAGASPEDLARDENYWSEIQQAFSVTRSIINLNNGGVCPSPRMVTEAFVRYIWESEEAPVYTMWQILQPRKENVRQRLAVLFGCDPEEVALVRNTSEAMEILLLGLDLQSGDEILTTTQDYGRMLTTIRQRVRREGIDLKFIQIPTPAETDEEVVEGFRNAITDKTRVILMSHQINLTGQILPVKAVCDVAREHGIEVMVDGAHSFAQFDFKLAGHRLRLLRHQPSQVAARPQGHRDALREEGQDPEDLAHDAGSRAHGRGHPQVRGDRHPSRRQLRGCRRSDHLPQHGGREEQGGPAPLPEGHLGRPPVSAPRIPNSTPRGTPG